MLLNSCSSSQISTFNRSQRFIILFVKSLFEIEGSIVVPVFYSLKANGDKSYSSTYPQLFSHRKCITVDVQCAFSFNG
jgi:hypothetical protein